jgi:hypothetical protein
VLLLLGLAAIASGQTAILQIRVVEGEGAVHVPGSRARPLIVEITDETGKPVSGAAVSFHLPGDGPGGTFVNGLRTSVVLTDARGRAGIQTLQVNRSAGAFQIRILASKEQARAGMVSLQYISESGSSTAIVPAVRSGAPPVRVPAKAGPSRGKWYVVAALAGGGAVAGILAANRSGHPAAAVPPAPPQPPAFGIGAPSITVGKP